MSCPTVGTTREIATIYLGIIHQVPMRQPNGHRRIDASLLLPARLVALVELLIALVLALREAPAAPVVALIELRWSGVRLRSARRTAGCMFRCALRDARVLGARAQRQAARVGRGGGHLVVVVVVPAWIDVVVDVDT